MNILMATSEAVPFAKTGGLADVCGALPRELARLGHHPVLIMPAYRKARYGRQPIERTGIDFIVPIGSKMVTGHLLQSSLPGGDVPVYLIEQDQYFDRDELYGADGKDYIDNCERFVFFCRAVLEAIRLLDLDVDVLHANDWQTGLIPAYLEIEYRAAPRYERIASLFTIHNMAYQGQFWHWDMLLTGLDWRYFNWHQMEFHGKLNLMKTGLVFANSINTVSRRYAKEIQSPPFGCGLEGVLQHRGDVLSGILNGIDTQVWNPKTDRHLAANYDLASVGEGKPICKAALQEEFGLPTAPDVPLIGLVSRLADQKGLDLVADVIQRWVQTNDAQWVILGTGQPKYHRLFETLVERFPQKVAARLEFSDPLAHRVEAGSDIFLMPSRYEPCGLNQFYSLRYGTIPVVRATGGLADTIVPVTGEPVTGEPVTGEPVTGEPVAEQPVAEQPVAEQWAIPSDANGFSFQEYSPLALNETLRRACDAYADPKLWRRLMATAMSQDWSWQRSAKQYVELYEAMVARAKQTIPA